MKERTWFKLTTSYVLCLLYHFKIIYELCSCYLMHKSKSHVHLILDLISCDIALFMMLYYLENSTLIHVNSNTTNQTFNGYIHNGYIQFNWHVFKYESESVSSSVLSDFLWPHVCNPPGSSVRGILQGRLLEWVVIPFSRGSS